MHGVDGVLGGPLERGEGLGHEHAGRGRHAHAALGPLLLGHAVEGVHHLFRQIADAAQVFVGFGGQAHHEVQLHAAPAAFKSAGDGTDQIVLRDALVDHVAQPLGARFGGQGQAGFFHLLGFFQRLLHDVVDAHTGQGHADALVLVAVHQCLNQLGQAGIVAAGQGRQAHFFVAGGLL